MNSLDIIFLAIVAAFLFFKLFSVFGRKDIEHPTITPTCPGNTCSQPTQLKEVESLDNANHSPEKRLKILNPSFNKDDFANKAQQAYTMVIEAYVSGNNHILSDLVGIEVLRNMAYNITKREEDSLTCHVQVLKIKDTKINNTTIDNLVAQIEISLNIEKIFYLEDQNNNVVSGSKTKVDQTTHTLTFSRHLASNDPTWKIIKIDPLPF